MEGVAATTAAGRRSRTGPRRLSWTLEPGPDAIGASIRGVWGRELLLLEELAEAAEQAHRLVADVSLQALAEDRVLREAQLGNFNVLGEAASQLPDEFIGRHPQVRWRQPVRLRNRIAHGYWSIDLEILHTTAQNQLPEFAAEVRRILATLTDVVTD